MICCSRCLEILLGSKITWPVLKATPHSNSFRSQPLVSISTPLKCNGLPLTNDRWKIIPTFIMVGWKRKISHFRRYLQNVYFDFIFIIQNWFIYSSSLPCLLDLVGHPKKNGKVSFPVVSLKVNSGFRSHRAWFLWDASINLPNLEEAGHVFWVAKEIDTKSLYSCHCPGVDLGCNHYIQQKWVIKSQSLW